MKNIIVTMAIVVLMTTIAGYQGLLNRSLRLEKQLKFAADEGGATASLFIDNKAYGEGILRFDKEAATKKISRIVQENLKNFGIDGEKEIEFLDENQERPYVRVTVKSQGYEAQSLYELRSPF